MNTMNLLLSLTNGSVIDLVAICLIAITAFIGLYRGFAKTFISTFGSIVSLVLAILLCSSVAGFLQSKFGVISAISDRLSGILTGIFGETLMDTTLQQATDGSLAEAGVAGWIANIILSIKGSGNVDMNVTLNQIICPVFGYYITAILAVLILFILFKILLFLLGEFVKKLSEIKVVGAVDRILGLMLGIVKGVIFIQSLILMINVIPVSVVQEISLQIENTVFVKLINDINIFGILINAVSGIGNIIEVITGAI